METNENSFNFGTAAEVVPPAPIQADFQPVEKMDPTDNKIPVSEEVVNKVVDGDHVQNNDLTDGAANMLSKEHANMLSKEHANMLSKEHANMLSKEHVNNKDDAMSCDEPPVQSPVIQSPVKPQINSIEPEHKEAEIVNEVSESIPVENDKEMEQSEAAAAPAEEDAMEQDREVEQEKSEEVQEPAEADSTPTLDGVVNDVHHSEDETKVEEVNEEVQHDKVEESTTEPVIEEPTEQTTESKDQVDGQVDHDHTKPDSDTKGDVEICDVTDKPDQPALVEEKKSDEELLKEHINSAYQCLDDFMKTQDELKIKDCMSLLTEIKTLTIKTVDSLKAFTAAQKDVDKAGHSSKKGKRSKSSTTKGSKSSTKADKNDMGAESDSADPLEEVNLKEIKGLAVFAKWPNSGWFYPGVVRDLALSDWKSGNQNLTVTFYDGLERDMKSINILPAELIPTSSVLFDLDEETDLIVSTVEREDNWVKFAVTAAGQSEQVVKDFDKMAIKGAHMKTIKQAVESSSPEAKETLVTGRRARGKSSVFNEDYVSSSSPRSSEKRKSKVDDSKSTPAKAPAKRKSSSKDDDESGEMTPSRSASKRRQVNGTKSTPRRASRK